MNSKQGYYTQFGEVGQYGSYHRPKISKETSFFEGLKDQLPYFAAFAAIAVGGTWIAKYAAETAASGMLSGLSTAQKISYVAKDIALKIGSGLGNVA